MIWPGRKLWGATRVSSSGRCRAMRCCADVTMASLLFGLTVLLAGISLSAPAGVPAGASPPSV